MAHVQVLAQVRVAMVEEAQVDLPVAPEEVLAEHDQRTFLVAKRCTSRPNYPPAYAAFLA